jgi:hypothetical protein
MANNELDARSLIAFWESILQSHAWLMNPSTETIIMQTIELLKRGKCGN